MAEVVNLNRFRKAKLRAEDERQAAENRVRFGRGKARRKAEDKEAERQAGRLDEKKLED